MLRRSTAMAAVQSIGRVLLSDGDLLYLESMLISMTGFGRSVRKSSFGRIIVEIQSVNRKHLELLVSLPKELSLYEMEIRKAVSEKIGRGQVSLRVYLSAEEFSGLVLPDVELLKQIKKAWTGIARECGCDEKGIDLPFLLQNLPQNGSPEWREEQLQAIKESVQEALQAALEMKGHEGKALERDMVERLRQIRECVRQIETLSPGQVVKQRAKLAERMAEALQPGSDLDERLLREIAFFAEKVDIAEELTRLRSHLEQFGSILSSKEKSVGRKLEFVVQEMGREINTIGSKSLDAMISRHVVEAKSELEKIREQIQNVE